MMKICGINRRKLLQGLAFSAAGVGAGALANFDREIKIGLVADFSGPFADYGQEFKKGIQVYLALHDNLVAGRPVKFIERDVGGIAPEKARRWSHDLVAKDKVNVLAGYGLSPNGIASASVSRDAKIPMVVMNAASVEIPKISPYVVRVAQTMNPVTYAAASWLVQQREIKQAFVMVADFSAGHDVEEGFISAFGKLGGGIIDTLRVPVDTLDFGPYLQRVIDRKPECLFFFVPKGKGCVALVRDMARLDISKRGILPMGMDITSGEMREVMGDSALGLITTWGYAQELKNEANRIFLKAYREKYPGDEELADLMTVGGYDGMEIIARGVGQGEMDGETFVKNVGAGAWESPRGAVHIDPKFREVVADEYIRRVTKKNGKYVNEVIAKVSDVGPFPLIED